MSITAGDETAAATPRPTRSASGGERVIETDWPAAFDVASQKITPLQRRVLDVLTPFPQAVEEIAEALRPRRTMLANRNPAPSDPDVATTRNVLGWLAAKGLAECDRSARNWRLAG